MEGTLAFLSNVPLRVVRKQVYAEQILLPRCSSAPQPSRRHFLRQIAGATTAVILSTTQAIAQTQTEPEVSTPTGQTKPRSKPRKAAWGYDEDNGPASWGSMQEEWAICDTGKEQSPVALSYREATSQSASRPTLKTSPGKVTVRMREVNPSAVNRSLLIEPYIPPPPPLVGDAPPVDVYRPPEPLAIVTIPDAGTYAFRSCHFHVGGSEHVVEGKRGDMEIHFAFEKISGQWAREKPLAAVEQTSTETVPPPLETIVTPTRADGFPAPQALVVAIICDQAENSDLWLQELFENFPLSTSEIESRPAGIAMDFDFRDILPDLEHTSFFSYDGSFTRPPGTEGIRWLVMGERTKVAKQDLQDLLAAQNGSNVRPLQPLNQRKVFRFPAIPNPGD